MKKLGVDSASNGKVKMEGVITVEEAKVQKQYVDVVEGMQFG